MVHFKLLRDRGIPSSSCYKECCLATWQTNRPRSEAFGMARFRIVFLSRTAWNRAPLWSATYCFVLPRCAFDWIKESWFRLLHRHHVRRSVSIHRRLNNNSTVWWARRNMPAIFDKFAAEYCVTFNNTESVLHSITRKQVVIHLRHCRPLESVVARWKILTIDLK